MRKTMMTAAIALAATVTAAAPMAFAQTNSAATTSAPTVTTNHMMPGQIRGTDLKGTDVYDRENAKVGDIRDMVLGHDGRVAAVVIDVDGKNVGVPMQDLHIAMNQDNKIQKITIDRSRSELRSAETFQLDAVRSTAGSGSSTAPAMIPADRSR